MRRGLYDKKVYIWTQQSLFNSLGAANTLILDFIAAIISDCDSEGAEKLRWEL